MSQRFTKAFSEGLRVCSKEVTVYGGCIKTNLNELEKGVCEQEFQQLKRCMRSALRQALAKSRR